MTKHIFMSYRSLEKDFALKLAADLKNAGVRLWMDVLRASMSVSRSGRMLLIAFQFAAGPKV
jgi:hypothetical protein